MNTNIFTDGSVDIFISELNYLLENETFRHCYYDFPRVEIRQKHTLYEILERIKNVETHYDSKYKRAGDISHVMKQFCEEINKKLTSYHVTRISNISCGKTYKTNNNSTCIMQLNDGYYYKFTVVCCKNDMGNPLF